jgi:hypothetical protein
MSTLGDISDLLRRWDVWKRVEEAPSRLDALEKRVAALEAGQASGPAQDTCPFCRTGKMVVTDIKPHGTFGVMGVEERSLKCDSCGKTQSVMHDPNNVTGGQARRR